MENREEGRQTYKEYLQILRECSPYDFCEYSDNSIDRRIQKIMRDHDINIDELIYKTRTDVEFVELVVEAITVNTTELFRDPEIWKFLLNNVLPALTSRPKINIWHTGCSSGQEVYSNMILLHWLGILDKCEIIASDISKKSLDIATSGSYKYSFNIEKYLKNFLATIPGSKQEEFMTYFDIDEVNDLLMVKPFLLKRVKYIKHDLVKQDLPFINKMDLIFCRNVLIYFNTKLQSRIIQGFHNTLFPGGYMVLGCHESIDGFFKTRFAKVGPVYSRANAFHFKY